MQLVAGFHITSGLSGDWERYKPADIACSRWRQDLVDLAGVDLKAPLARGDGTRMVVAGVKPHVDRALDRFDVDAMQMGGMRLNLTASNSRRRTYEDAADTHMMGDRATELRGGLRKKEMTGF